MTALTPIYVGDPLSGACITPRGSALMSYSRAVGYDAGYVFGYADGTVYGYTVQEDNTMMPIKPGETDSKKKTISFRVYDTTGAVASGMAGEGAVFAPGAGDVQVNRDGTGYVNSAGTFAHVGDGVYIYIFANAEVAAAGGEGHIFFRVKAASVRTVLLTVPLRYGQTDVIAADAVTASAVKADAVTKIQAGLATSAQVAALPSATDIRDAVLNAARSGHVTLGSVGEGIALAAALLQGNFYMDEVDNTSPNGQTAARIRVFHTGGAAATASAGGSGEGEFATFLVTTTYAGPNKVLEHRVVQQ